jgi:hypothetical protein
VHRGVRDVPLVAVVVGVRGLAARTGAIESVLKDASISMRARARTQTDKCAARYPRLNRCPAPGRFSQSAGWQARDGKLRALLFQREALPAETWHGTPRSSAAEGARGWGRGGGGGRTKRSSESCWCWAVERRANIVLNREEDGTRCEGWAPVCTQEPLLNSTAVQLQSARIL